MTGKAPADKSWVKPAGIILVAFGFGFIMPLKISELREEFAAGGLWVTAGVLLGSGTFAAIVVALLLATDRIKNQSIRYLTIFFSLVLFVAGLAMIARIASGLSLSDWSE